MLICFFIELFSINIDSGPMLNIKSMILMSGINPYLSLKT